jgi:glyoxylase I family protein
MSKREKYFMKIEQLHHISMVIADIERSRQFYCGLLQLPEIPRPDLGFDGFWIGIGSFQIHFLKVTNVDPVIGRPEHVGRDRHVALEVDDLKQVIDRLNTDKIPYTVSKSGRNAIFFRDPDGNGIELIMGYIEN